MNDSPRIAHVISAKTWRGGEQQAVWLYEDLEKLGVFQLIFCPKGSATESYCEKNGLRYRAFSKTLNYDPIFAAKMSAVCKEENLNILHPHGSGAHSLAIMSIDLFANPCAVLLHRRVDFPISGSRISRYKYNHPSIKKILCVSEAIRKIMEKDIRRPELLDVVYDGIDLSRFSSVKGKRLHEEFHIDPATPLIGNVAALTQQKDYYTFIDTIKLLRNQGIKARYFAIGDGKQKEELVSYAKNQDVDDVLTFTGFRTDVPEILPELDVFLFTSETEGLGTSILDAFASGVPVVSTDAGGIPEILHPLKNGFLAPVKNPEKLAEGVVMALKNPDKAKAWTEQAKKDVAGFSREIMAEQILKQYNQIIASEKH